MITNIKKFAIRHNPSGHYLPIATGRMGRGGSHVEPCEPQEGEPSTHPRLFDTFKSAQNCLTQWLRGRHHQMYDYEECFGREVKMDAGTSIEPVPTRIKEDMEIVHILLKPESF